MVSEVTITVKNEEKRQTHKSLVYDNFTVSEEDPILKNLMDKAVAEFNDEVEKVQVKITMEVQ